MSSIDNLLRVARALKPIREQRFVFVGASVLPFLIDDPGAQHVRATLDVDLVVDVLSVNAFDALRTRLASCDLRVHANTAPGKGRFCLFYLSGNPPIEVDVMPVRVRELGCPSRMLDVAFDFAEPERLAEDLTILRISAGGLLAAKLEAYFERGVRDVFMSKDLEDIALLLDGRLHIEEEIMRADPETRQFIVRSMDRLLRDKAARDVIADVLRDRGRRERMSAMMGRIAAI